MKISITLPKSCLKTTSLLGYIIHFLVCVGKKLIKLTLKGVIMISYGTVWN